MFKLSHRMQAMSEIWGSGEHVQCIHPAAGCIAGRESVSPPYLPCKVAKTLCCKRHLAQRRGLVRNLDMCAAVHLAAL